MEALTENVPGLSPGSRWPPALLDVSWLVGPSLQSLPLRSRGLLSFTSSEDEPTCPSSSKTTLVELEPIVTRHDFLLATAHLQRLSFQSR